MFCQLGLPTAWTNKENCKTGTQAIQEYFRFSLIAKRCKETAITEWSANPETIKGNQAWYSGILSLLISDGSTLSLLVVTFWARIIEKLLLVANRVVKKVQD